MVRGRAMGVNPRSIAKTDTPAMLARHPRGTAICANIRPRLGEDERSPSQRVDAAEAARGAMAMRIICIDGLGPLRRHQVLALHIEAPVPAVVVAARVAEAAQS